MASHLPPFPIPQNFKNKANNVWMERKIESFSDGDRSKWPTSQYRPSQAENYLCVLGQSWAEADGIAEDGVTYYLDRLPDGYALFEIDQPGGPQTYKRLFGHPSGRFFDSVRRFVPHFLWLMNGMASDCECVYCSKTGQKPVVPRARKPRDTIDASLLRQAYAGRDLSDLEHTDSERSESVHRGGARVRPRRQTRKTGEVYACDEEGTEDVYKDCVRRLEQASRGTNGIEDDLKEEGSIDWVADRSSLPQHLTQIGQQHSFLPRAGELVLWCPSFPPDQYLARDEGTEEFKFYSFREKSFTGFPQWRGGIIAATPSSTDLNSAVDFPDLLDVPGKKIAVNMAGFRVETVPDSNDDLNKSLSKQYRYVHLRNIRPLSQWQILLRGYDRTALHPSIFNALTLMTTINLLEKWRFIGDWPQGCILCKGAFIGSELVIVGDTIRFMNPSGNSADARSVVDVMVVTSIRYNLSDIQLEHASAASQLLSSKSYITFVGDAYTTDTSRALSDTAPLDSDEIKSAFRPVGTGEYGKWYRRHQSHAKFEISHEKVLGRLMEADAVRLWLGQRQTKSIEQRLPNADLGFDMTSIIAGRAYATATDARLAEPLPGEINWFLADSRAQGLGVMSLNGIDVGKYHQVRDKPTLKQWRTQLLMATGKEVSAEQVEAMAAVHRVASGYSGGRRGRPPGTRVIDGKLVYPGQTNDQHEDEDVPRMKSSSQMAGAALAFDSSESSQDESIEEEGESHDDADEPVQTVEEDGTRPPVTAGTLSKSAIMGNIDAAAEIVGLEEDEESDEFDYDKHPLPIRGGTEESEGGDYRE